MLCRPYREQAAARGYARAAALCFPYCGKQVRPSPYRLFTGQPVQLALALGTLDLFGGVKGGEAPAGQVGG
ncbi:hypothetical protein GCM10010844_17410 [Deinococcus radiotolerans]|uniref:Uncharacterized protein n=1 Tax=Deinococcus radiotolerans TaxID=1309407 RepID=A0ABQ2FJX3_9DEIO|nr:hypothetical protein GCM10010844_17410 [Deinococcus radiotolerans]